MITRKRKKAGRPRLGAEERSQTVTVKLTPDVRAALERLMALHKLTRSQAIRAAIIETERRQEHG